MPTIPVNVSKLLQEGKKGASQIKDPTDLPPRHQSLFKSMLMAVMNDPGLSPMGLGVVAGSQGGAKLASTLLQDGEELTPVQNVVRYFQLKYPRLMKSIRWGTEITDKLPNNVKGGYTGPEDDRILINANQTSPQDAVNTLGHELVHGGIQGIRTPLMANQYIYPAQNFDAYQAQPAEVNARQGGQTAVNTFNTFLQQYPDLKKMFGQ